MKTNIALEERSIVFVNSQGGSADKVRKALKHDSRVCLKETEPDNLRDAIESTIKQGVDRILISGGDGTIALCASVLAGTDILLGIIPGGTLNHFALRHNIPIEPLKALEIALADQTKKVDVAYVNEQLFINTSSVGAYVHFVHSRDHFQQKMNYYFASFVAGIRRLVKLRSMKLQLSGKKLLTPLVFIGVGERELQFPSIGAQAEKGIDKLHVISIKDHNKLTTLKIATKALLFGIDPLAQKNQIENALLDDIEINFVRNEAKKDICVSVDGELLPLQMPLRYHYAPDELNLLAPE